MMSKPASCSARGLVVGISSGSRPGRTRRRRRQKSGWISTGMFAWPSERISPSSPAVWSKWPWLHTTASMLPGSMSRYRMFAMTPSGLVPVSNRNRCSAPPLATVTRTEKPCSAISAPGSRPSTMVRDGRRGPRPRAMRWAGPWSGMSASVTLSINVVTTTESTGSRSISMAGSTSCRTGTAGWAGLSSVHMALGPGPGRRRDLQRLVDVDAVAEVGAVAVHLGGVQAAHEGQDLRAEHLARYEHREARRVGRDVRGGHDLLPGLDPLLDLIGHEVLAVAVVIGQVEGPPHVAFAGGQPAAVGEAGVEATEVGQRGRRRGQPQHRAFVRAALGGAHVAQLGFELAGYCDQHLDQVRHRAAGGADGGHEQDGVPGGLVDLHAVAVHQVAPLEHVALDPG